MNTSTQGQAVWYGDIFQLPEGVQDFLLDTSDPILDSEDLIVQSKPEVVGYDELMDIQDFYVAEGLDMEEVYDNEQV